MAFLKKINFGNGAVNIAKTVVQGKPEGVISVTNTSGFGNTDSEEKDYSYDIDVNVDGTTIQKSAAVYYTAEDDEVIAGTKQVGDLKTPAGLKVGTVPAANVSVAAGGHIAESLDGKTFVGDDVEEVLLELNTKIENVGGEAKSYTIVDDTANVQDLPANVLKRYRLQQTVGSTDTLVGAAIDIPKDSSLKEVYLGASTDTIDATTGVITKNTVTDPQSMNFAYQLADGTYSLVKIDVSKFLTESEFGDGLEVTDGVVKAKLGNGLGFGSESDENKSINVKIDSTSETDSASSPAAFLSVGANGVKISGIKDEIDRKIAALDYSDTAVSGKYVSEVDETDGKISVARANVSDAPLNGYEKGDTEGALAATDTINGAFSKLENTIENNEQTTAAALNNLNSRIDAMDKSASAVAGQVVTTVAEADGVVSETKANVKDLELGGYANDTTATGAIGGTDTINTALSKLENQIAAAGAAATTKVVEGTDAGNNLEITSATSQSDGSTTYTINLTDVASKTALDNEVTRAQSAEAAIDTAVGLTKASGSETRSFTATTNYGTGSTTVMGNMQALDTQLKTVSDNLAAITYEVSGTELILRGIDPYQTPQP